MFYHVCDFFIDDFCPLLSDVHNPVQPKLLIKNCNLGRSEGTKGTENSSEQTCKLWDRHHPDLFVDSIDMLKLCEIESNLNRLQEINDIDISDVDLIVRDISNLFKTGAEKAYGCNSNRNFTKKYNTVHNNSKRKPWFGNECKNARKSFTSQKMF